MQQLEVAERWPDESVDRNERNGSSSHSSRSRRSPSTTPDGGYGWVNVACICIVNAHTWGINSSYGVFLNYYLRHSIFPDTSRLDYTFVGGLSISVTLLCCPIGTLLTRKYGTRNTMLIGAVLQAASLVAASFSKRSWELFVTQGVMYGCGMGLLFMATVGLIPQWFTTHRSLANGITAAGSGLGGTIYSLSANAMISRLGLPWTFRVIGSIVFVVNVTCALIIKDRHSAIGSTHIPVDFRLFKRPEYLLLLLFGTLFMLGYVALLFSLPNYATSVGLSEHHSSIIGAIFNLGQALGRPNVGYFSDSMGRLNMATTTTFIAGLLSLVGWRFATSYGTLIVFALFGGTVAGTYWAVIAPVTTEVVGLVDLQSALSLNWMMLSLPTTFSEAIALRIVDLSGGSYLGAQLFSGFMYIGAAVFLWLVRTWKIGELEHTAAISAIDALAAAEQRSSSPIISAHPSDRSRSRPRTPSQHSSVAIGSSHSSQMRKSDYSASTEDILRKMGDLHSKDDHSRTATLSSTVSEAQLEPYIRPKTAASAAPTTTACCSNCGNESLVDAAAAVFPPPPSYSQASASSRHDFGASGGTVTTVIQGIRRLPQKSSFWSRLFKWQKV